MNGNSLIVQNLKLWLKKKKKREFSAFWSLLFICLVVGLFQIWTNFPSYSHNACTDLHQQFNIEPSLLQALHHCRYILYYVWNSVWDSLRRLLLLLVYFSCLVLDNKLVVYILFIFVIFYILSIKDVEA